MRIAVIGDVGGHREPFEKLLRTLGCDPARGTIPRGLTVVQVGDLVHRGPDSPGVVRLVERFLDGPGWVQLVGNHEAQYLHPDGPMFGWPSEDDPPRADVERLQHWWADGRLRVAFGVQRAFGRGVLCTHAGLTAGLAGELMIDDVDAPSAAAALNALPRDRTSPLWRAGVMLGFPEDHAAGPLWAAAGVEVAASWADGTARPSYDQVVGHSQLFDWHREQWWLPRRLLSHAAAFPERRHAVVEVAGSRIWAIDPTHLEAPGAVWDPFIVEV